MPQKKRFSVKKLKLCSRNSMIRGNPVERSFVMYGVFDRLAKDDHSSGCYLGGYELWKYGHWIDTVHDFRTVLESKDVAAAVAYQLNKLWNELGQPAKIGFSKVDHRYNPLPDNLNDIKVTFMQT